MSNALDTAKNLARSFLTEDPDPDHRATLTSLLARVDADDDGAANELRDRFSAPLAFGTAGLRGEIGPGIARMNRVVVMRAAFGLGRYLLDDKPKGIDAKKRGVVIGFDGRRYSRQFAEDTAAVFAGLGIPAHLFIDPVPTPVLAFGITSLGAAAGVMVTASHNPPDDNGYKVYLGNGAQIIPPHDEKIAAAIATAPRIPDMKRVQAADAAMSGLRFVVDDSVARAYLDGVKRDVLHNDVGDVPVRVVYTAMHGVGHAFVARALNEAGFKGVHVVTEQTDPDGNFPTVRFPNPEEKGALDRAFALATAVNADLVVANDPDADRLAVALPDADGVFQRLSGNAIGALLGADAIRFADTGGKKKLVVTSLVSSTMLSRIAKGLGAAYEETLTGFKWIANRAMAKEASDDMAFVCGYEEALGYSVGPMVRDKDGVSAVVRFVELFAHLKKNGRTVVDELTDLAVKFGFSQDLQWSITMPGTDGRQRIDGIMAQLRTTPLTTLGGRPIVRVNDLQDGAMDAPADVLVYFTDDDVRLTVRPSGTEPKIKFYLEAAHPVANAAAIDDVRAKVTARLGVIRKEIETVLGVG